MKLIREKPRKAMSQTRTARRMKLEGKVFNMGRLALLAGTCLVLAAGTLASGSDSPDPYANETRAERDARMAWWREAKFGMFIHWGVYAVPAGTYNGKRISGIGGSLGPGLDGLFCLENGDILAAGFVTGQILYLPWDDTTYGDPIVIEEGLDNPTDLVVGPSSRGADYPDSLYVTTLIFWRVLPFFKPAGKVIEIPDIRARISDKL